jgi:hypothetical protein
MGAGTNGVWMDYGFLAGMSWHRTPTDDAWNQAHLAMAEKLGCDACRHTPLLTLSRALRCTRCGERRGQARLEPHGYSAC